MFLILKLPSLQFFKFNSNKLFFHDGSKRAKLRRNLLIFYYIEKIKPFFLKKFLNKFFLHNGKKDKAEFILNQIFNKFNIALLRSKYYRHYLLYKTYPYIFYFKFKFFQIFHLTLTSKKITTFLVLPYRYKGISNFYFNDFNKNIEKNSNFFNLRNYQFFRFFFLRKSTFELFFKTLRIYIRGRRFRRVFKELFKVYILNSKNRLRLLNKNIIN